MNKIVAFSGSNHSKSINQQLVQFVATSLGPVCEVVDLRAYPLPLYSQDLEEAEGFPEKALELKALFQTADGFVLSCPEHNGSMPAVFKNTIDWLSRLEGKIFNEKPMLLMSASPGPNGGQTNRANLEKLLPWWGAQVVATFSLGEFYKKFDEEKGMFMDQEAKVECERVIATVKKRFNVG